MLLPATGGTTDNANTSIPSFIDMSDTDSPIKSFSLSNKNSDDSSMKRAKIVNSTPVVRHGYRSRNFLSSSLNSSTSSLNESSITRKKLFASSENDSD